MKDLMHHHGWRQTSPHQVADPLLGVCPRRLRVLRCLGVIVNSRFMEASGAGNPVEIKVLKKAAS